MWCVHVGWCRIKVLRSSFHDRFACGAGGGVLLARVGQAIRSERMCPATTRTKTRLCTKRCDSVVVPFPMRCPSSHRTVAGKGNLNLGFVRDGIIGNLTFSLALSSTCGRVGNCRFSSFFFFLKCHISHGGLHLPCLLSSLSLWYLPSSTETQQKKKNAFLATKSSRDSRSRFITNRNRRVSEGERGMRAGLPPHGQTTGAAQAAKKIVVAGSGHGSLEGEALGACSSAWSRRARRRYSRPPRTALRRRNRHACVRVGRIAQPMGWGVCV